MSAGHPIRGLYETCIGVPDIAYAERFWGQFGYKQVESGSLSADRAEPLYGHASAVSSLRLQHLDADHSFIRLMAWETPRNPGIGITKTLRQDGGRWSVVLTESILNILNHVEDAQNAGEPWNYIFPHWLQIYAMEKGEPFFDAPIGVREGIACHPLWRLALFERYNYEKPTYGQIDPASFLKSSQFTHHGIMLRMDDPAPLAFYSDVLGLLKQKEHTLGGKPTCSSGNQQTFSLGPDEIYHIHDFDDPRSSLEIAGHISGRLKIVRMATSAEMPDVHDKSSPGSLGQSLYTWQVRDLAEYHDRVTEGGASKVTAIADNEFGEPMLVCTAPDGNVMGLVGNL